MDKKIRLFLKNEQAIELSLFHIRRYGILGDVEFGKRIY
ncbi:hypothetical protein BMWSH_4127 [Priestia megaterium WSH-002]|uniref:Uncharacterized protein n=1 Tax=Priestia megaterium (strain WSH-002) TaxID=1006007 RepID=A0A8D3X285_PRIMW|nr:hypothetical protein BMWSH_4127 [Priestia megaterium WSH-002]